VRLRCFIAITLNLNADVKKFWRVEVNWKEKKICTLTRKKREMKNDERLDRMLDSPSTFCIAAQVVNRLSF